MFTVQEFKGGLLASESTPSTIENSIAVDEHVLSLVETCMGVNIDTAWSAFTKLRLVLPIRFKGMGIGGAADCQFSHLQYRDHSSS